MRPFLILLALPLLASAGVVRVEVEDRTDVAGGRAFGLAGPYERIVAKVRFAVDPKLAANRIISDIDLAPKNAAGLVEFSADLYVIKPRMSRDGNGTVLFEVSNRGGQGMLGMFGSGARNFQEDAGDGFLLERGYTLVWLGWQWDVPKGLKLYAPVAKNPDGSPIRGIVRAEFTPERAVTTMPLADRNHMAYKAVETEDPGLTLTVREQRDAPRRTIPRSAWKFAPSADRITMDAGFQPHKLYELVYRSENPVLVGLGPAAIRDFISFLKYGGGPGEAFLLGDQKQHLQRAIGFGTSQSGRFLRTFLYYGFNADERGRKVFDGVWPHVAGAGRGSFNHRFAQPSRDGHPNLNTFYPSDLFPFTDDGLLERARAANVVPRIFYTNGSYEYWGRNASLIHTTPDGKADAPPAAESRIYFLAGTQHGPGAALTGEGSQNLANPANYRWNMRALLVAMNNWLTRGTEPPPPAYPRIDRDQLVPLAALAFPKVPGVTVPLHPFTAYMADYGPDFATRGIVTVDPPRISGAYATLFPQVDRDGNETSGIRMPELQAPLATYTGWNLIRAPGVPNEMFAMRGSYIPFARTRAERERSKDPRPSIEERYPSRAAYLEAVRKAAAELSAQRYLLEQDLAPVVEHAVAEWDRVQR